MSVVPGKHHSAVVSSRVSSSSLNFDPSRSPEWKLLALYDNTQPMTLLEKAMSYSALTSWFLILVYKGLRNDLVSMLQPCHVNLMVLIFILNFPKKYTLPHFVFNIFAHGIWGT